jgi:hypothetical protein
LGLTKAYMRRRYLLFRSQGKCLRKDTGCLFSSHTICGFLCKSPFASYNKYSGKKHISYLFAPHNSVISLGTYFYRTKVAFRIG